MKKAKILNLVYSIIFLALTSQISGCHDDIGEPWKIKVGGKIPNRLALVDGDAPQQVRVCLDRKGGSGYPITIVGIADGESYAGMLLGQCMFFEGKRVEVKFGTPTSGMFAEGTYSIIQQ